MSSVPVLVPTPFGFEGSGSSDPYHTEALSGGCVCVLGLGGWSFQSASSMATDRAGAEGDEEVWRRWDASGVRGGRRGPRC